VPSRFHAVSYDETTELYTCTFEFKINLPMVMENQGVTGTIGQEITRAMVLSNYSIRSREVGAASVLLGYYTQGTPMSAPEIDAIDRAYDDSTYVPGSNISFPDVIHFCVEPTDEAEYVALTGGRYNPDLVTPPAGGDDDTTVDDGAELEEEEKDDKKDDAAKAPATTAATEEAKKGCKAMIGSGAIALVATVGCGVSVVSRKKRK
jgi:hypothetical protein